MSKTTLGILYMILSGLFFGGVRTFSKIIVQDIPVLTFTTLRMISALLILSAFGYKYFSQISSISKQDWKKITIASLIGMMGMAIAFTLSVKRTTVINSSFLFFIPAAILPIAGALFAKLKIKTTTYEAVPKPKHMLGFLYAK